jgi:hypothetical protein
VLGWKERKRKIKEVGMMNTIFLVGPAMVLMAALAAGQAGSHPQASLDRELGWSAPPNATDLNQASRKSQIPPKYCKPCLFYAGDFDSNASDANGLANEVDVIISTGAAVYVPFIVPKGKTWTVTGLFTSNFMSSGTLDPKTSPYEIRKDIPRSGGNGGTVVCHGNGLATVTDTHTNGGIAFEIFAVNVGNIKGCRLRSGKYWVSVVPYCTNTNNCSEFRSFVANDDGAMANRFGPLEPAGDSFFNSIFFGAVWEPSTEQQTSKRFVAGVEGTAK